MKYMVFPIQGSLDVSSLPNTEGDSYRALTFSPTNGATDFEAELDSYTTGWQSHNPQGSFDDAEKAEQFAYQQWLSTMLAVSAAFGRGAELAAYVNWESIVAPSGNLKRPAMLMSKNWMESVWSWDHAFNAMATSFSDGGLAWDQLLLPFDVEDSEGALPDKWDADTIAWEFSKPPIHGWALGWMLDHKLFADRKHLEEIYPLLARWTEWYFRYRDSDHDGLPEYRHGNESGWDNSTVFRHGTPLESPDLSALLSVQTQVLAQIATRLAKTDEAKRWQQKSDELLTLMLERFWKDGEFVAIRVSDGQPIHSESLLLSIPIILGPRLPIDVRQQMVAQLKRRVAMTPLGLASEPPDSPFYESDGYWRGPIWAPSTMIIATGLEEIGEKRFADTLKKQFCEMAQQSGMAENFNARTGEPLRDPSYTWTSSVYLLFAHDLAETLEQP
jgi:glycogen debranching enzyme